MKYFLGRLNVKLMTLQNFNSIMYIIRLILNILNKLESTEVKMLWCSVLNDTLHIPNDLNVKSKCNIKFQFNFWSNHPVCLTRERGRGGYAALDMEIPDLCPTSIKALLRAQIPTDKLIKCHEKPSQKCGDYSSWQDNKKLNTFNLY